MKTIILWFRNDLRVHDLPMLAAAHDADRVIPVFIFNKKLTAGDNASSNRNRFLLESLEDLKSSLEKLGNTLYIREGDAATELKKIAAETDAQAAHYTIDYTPFSIQRDQAVKKVLEAAHVDTVGFPGRLAIDTLQGITTKQGKVVKVFTPFHKQWQQIERRNIAATPRQLAPAPSKLTQGSLPSLASLTSQQAALSPDALPGGEAAARHRLRDWLDHGIAGYADTHNDLAADTTSCLSAYLHFGCLSVCEIETMLPPGKGVDAWHRQLAWRDFYHYILLNYPDNLDQELQERYRTLTWDGTPAMLTAWQQGQTGYPIIDAAMRQLNQEGWMHNRARLIVGSFLTKDLSLDWRDGQQYFMRMLIDGDNANNNGNWQWIASVGVDPAPLFRRLYNPATQQKNHDPDGIYVRKYVPELEAVSDKYLAEPWNMPDDVQATVGCIIGKDYPEPIVEHATERKRTLERYAATKPTLK